MKKTASALFCALTIISFTSPTQASTLGQAIPVSYAVDLNDPREQEQITPYGMFPQPFRFKSRSDRPHISASEGPRAVSVHGWWDQVSGSARTANVRIERWAKGPHDQGFRKVGTGTKNSVPGGGGRGNRATARAVCKNHEQTVFRGDVDVDINDYADVPGMVRGVEVMLPCGV